MKERGREGENMAGLTTDEAREQLAGMQVVGCGCLAVMAALLGAALLATCVIIDMAFDGRDEAVAAYSVCEMCGEPLEAGNVHGRCEGEGTGYADVR